MAWYKEWFDEQYLDLYAHRDEREAERQVDFVESQLSDGPRPRMILDLACGAGRHSDILSKRGYRVVGVDLSLTLLAVHPGPRRICGDMCSLPFHCDSFDWLLNFFTSFGYFERERQNFQVLEEITRVLRPGGRFLLDFLNRDVVINNLRPTDVQEDDKRRVEIERWYDPASQRINKRIRVQPRGAAPRTYLESVRAYSQEEVTIGMRWAGLEVDTLFGSFDGDSFHRDSERLIILGHKPILGSGR